MNSITSVKTTFAGVAAILVGLGMLGKIINDFLLGESVNMEQLAIAITAISGGAAGIFARDNTVSSQEVGIREEK